LPQANYYEPGHPTSEITATTMIFLVPRLLLLFLTAARSNGFSSLRQQQQNHPRSNNAADRRKQARTRYFSPPPGLASDIDVHDTPRRYRRRPSSSAIAASRQQETHNHHDRGFSLHILPRFNSMAKFRSNNVESNVTKQRRRKVLLLGLMVIVVPSILAAAGTARYYTGTSIGSLMRMGLTWMTRHSKGIRNAALLAALVVATQDFLRRRRRQAIDPTSEWARYAEYPVLRGLALCSVAVQVSVLAFLGKQRRLFPTLQARAGRCLVDGLLKVGPLYIKLGQIISSQSQLTPQEWAPALEKLQDQVPAQSGAQAAALAYAAWPGGQASFDETFESVDWTPLAAASLGQVHKATLRQNRPKPAPALAPAPPQATTTTMGSTSTEQPEQPPEPAVVVALKLQRPHLREIYDQDFAFLTSIAQTVDRWLEKSAGSIGGVHQNWSEIFRDAEAILYREIDYVAEAENGRRFNRQFGIGQGGSSPSSSAATDECTALARNGKPLSSAASWLRAPHVYKELSSEKVLVMEYVPSIKVTKNDALREAGVTARDKEYLAECLGRSYLRQLCCHKFCKFDQTPRCFLASCGQLCSVGGSHKNTFFPFFYPCQFPRTPTLAISEWRRWT
jgi:predicted unusual protein kinase regulating ubiquinone biosynthesis (AarF/ABC1/UbiB family)